MSFRLSPLQLALSVALAAATLAPFAVKAQSNDLQYLGDTLIFNVHQQASTKTRAEVLAEAVEFNKRAVLPDGWRHLNHHLEYVGQPSTRTRAEVLAEAVEWRKNPLSHDGWFELAPGYSVYKGLPAPKADMRMAEGK